MKNQSNSFLRFLGVILAGIAPLPAATPAKRSDSLKIYDRAETRTENRNEKAGKAQTTSATQSKRTEVAPASRVQSYTVESGDTISKIARKFKTTPVALMSLNKLSEGSILKVGQSVKITAAPEKPEAKAPRESTTTAAANPPGYTRHEVMKGETVVKLAKAYGVSADSILEANHLREGATLQVGRVISIPARGLVTTKTSKPANTTEIATATQRQNYEIHGKDTFYSLAVQNGITVEELQQANPGVNPDRLRPGMSIKIPVRNSRARPNPIVDADPAVPAPTTATARDLHTAKDNSKTPRIPLKKFEPIEETGSQPVVLRNVVDNCLDYTVEPGDTWETISGQFRTTSDEVKRLNGIRANDEPMSGVTIRVPRTKFMRKAGDSAGRVG